MTFPVPCEEYGEIYELILPISKICGFHMQYEVDVFFYNVAGLNFVGLSYTGTHRI